MCISTLHQNVFRHHVTFKVHCRTIATFSNDRHLKYRLFIIIEFVKFVIDIHQCVLILQRLMLLMIEFRTVNYVFNAL